MTDVTMDQSQDGAGLSAADEQLLRALTERARRGAEAHWRGRATGRRSAVTPWLGAWAEAQRRQQRQREAQHRLTCVSRASSGPELQVG